MSNSSQAGSTYDGFAEAYVARAETNAFNALYERPAIRALLPSVVGQHVLDAGCAGGAHSAWLLEQEAKVTALDVSAHMVALTRKRLGTRAQVHQADLREPLSFLEEGSVDIVLSSLTLHYLEHWEPTLKEFHRVLVPGGRLVFSTHHPLADCRWVSGGDYLQTERIEQHWEGFTETPVRVSFYRRPLGAIFAALAESGFVVEQLVEPRPLQEMREQEPEIHARLMKEPWFLLIRASRSQLPRA
ncbi:methyltransferase domain-containing protein [Archangium minus]|uniref:Methyltransferase domain-containing protein n=1 Tax=Archangium minus TaxID=83450 RepID=A0ABY9WPX6_9BACT|nr:methyltransferase domain-containing protein [Archangium minus]